MIEFASFRYLQNQKTGSTMVETFLRRHCSEDIVRYEKHFAPREAKRDKFCFISVREPLDTYLSLFNYGLDGKGELYARLRAAGKGALYGNGIDGFGDWLERLLDPASAGLSYPPRCVAVAPLAGLVSCRFLRLAAAGFEDIASGLTGKEGINAFFTARRSVDRVIRYETLRQDLTALAQGPLSHAFIDLAGAVDWIASSPRVNTSNRREKSGIELLTAAQRARLVEREWFIYRNYYADMAEKLTQ